MYLCGSGHARATGVTPCTEVRFDSFLSGVFFTAITVNLTESKLKKRTSVQWAEKHFGSQIKIIPFVHLLKDYHIKVYLYAK